MAGVTTLAVLLMLGGPARLADAAPSSAGLKAWQSEITKVPQPSARGCFTADYPRLAWHRTSCAAAPDLPMTPKHSIRPLVVGSGNDISAQAPSGFISESSGTFENIVNVTSESSPIANAGPPVADAYTLQINTDFFASTACAGSPNPGCRGWEQFVYANDGSSGLVFIQYWLLQYNAACPAGGWTQFSFTGDPDIYCYRNSPGATPVPDQPITNLGALRLTGTVSASSDSATLFVGATAYTAGGSNSVNAAAGWTVSEFNVFGYGGNADGGGQATFNSGASLNVRTRITYGGTAAPVCAAQGFTGETNNLDFGTPAPSFTPPGPAVVFVENTTGGAATNCAAATVVGDTHQHTFAGLLYDFQASGDFVEAQAGSGFEVQTRKVSGAPTWPNASVDRSVATRMGTTKVALCDGKSLVVDGRTTDIQSEGALHLPSGVDIHRVGNVYVVTDQSGNSIRVTVNSGYIDVAVGLGSSATQAVGLLGNPGGDPKLLAGRDGTRYAVPLSFDELYQKFGASWRVNPLRTLLAPCATVASGNPSAPFFAGNLTDDVRKRAESVCLQARVTPEWLDTCTLDVAVVGDRAASTYVGLAPPVVNGNR
ncbi:VWD domain-containing protein [Micromonospora auratinigra]|uniref:VWD domain-containing protein n=1 Tax=Micromonospora auratinigra TaxID=261654 RepID=UPI0012FDD5D5|nr:VWD domain-containing protein [Micromonospora auratinigra]